MGFCSLTIKHYTKKSGTKDAWELTEEEEREEISEEFYNNCVEAAPFFRRLGGSETLTREATPQGYRVTQIVSKSPDRQLKTVRQFKFK